MYCTRCGAQIPDVSKFCPNCGAAYSPPASTPPSAQGAGQAQEAQAKPLKRSRNSKTLLIVAVCVFLLACAVIIPVAVRAIRYQDAVALMDAGEASRAKETFAALGNYKEAASLAQECQNMLDYDTAKAYMESEDYEAAKPVLDRLSGYKDADALAAECQNAIDYNAAVVLMNDGHNEKARDGFLRLGAYRDSAALAKECKNKINYATAKASMDAGDYEKAAAVFTLLANYEDAAALAQECRNIIDYQAADEAFDEGNFYTAYILFGGLTGYSDADARAEECVQTAPSTGELYRNRKYASKDCSLTIKTPDDKLFTFLKLYTKDDVLVSTIFVASGKKAKINLPAGAYKMKVASGELWFGTQELFGDLGYYHLLTFENGKTTTSFKSNYAYTFSFRGEKDGNVGSKAETRDSF